MDKGFLAERLTRLGTETAFEVLARAKALEKQGKRIIFGYSLLFIVVLHCLLARHHSF